MNITGKMHIECTAFVSLPWNSRKTHCLVGKMSEHMNESFNNRDDGTIETSNINYIDIVDGVVYAITHSKSRYELTNVTVEQITEMVERHNSRDQAPVIGLFTNEF
ncbi:hypothetical protein VPHK567_0153 [Vibrio phage K567]|nr:hypothetical protein MYOV011v1_p0056 [Vibrio phage 6E35.1a]